MHAMRLHRSLGFWLGLLPVVFLLWVWMDSREWTSSWSRSSDPRHLHNDWVAISKSELILRKKVFVVGDDILAANRFQPRKEWGKFRRILFTPTGEDQGSWFPAPQELKASEPLLDYLDQDIGRIETSGFAVPLWLLLALYLVGWIGLAVWWRKRKQRLSVPSE